MFSTFSTKYFFFEQTFQTPNFVLWGWWAEDSILGTIPTRQVEWHTHIKLFE